jgi:RNA polymerase sigma-70 factor, ECF subfamily
MKASGLRRRRLGDLLRIKGEPDKGIESRMSPPQCAFGREHRTGHEDCQMDDITQLLVRWRDGDKAALEQLAPMVYDELRRLAKIKLSGESSDSTLQPTALVHEAYLRLAEHSRLPWQNRAHFFAIVANIMRRILIDDARKRMAEKRGGGRHITLDENIDVVGAEPPDILALDLALQSLAQVDERKSGIIELKYFGGLTAEEISEVTGLSIATIGRDLRLTHAWLHRELAGARRG